MTHNPCRKYSKEEILTEINNCQSIEELFSIVRREHIELRMQSLCSASCVPQRELTYFDNSTSPLDRLKAAVLAAAKMNL